MPPVPPLRRCTSYAPGHSVHFIQALHAANKPEVARRTRRGTLTAVDGDVLTIRIAGADVPERFRNHDPARLLAIAGVLPTEISHNAGYGLLKVGSYCFSVRRAGEGPLDPCPVDELADFSAEALADRTLSHGGFGIRPAGLA